MGYAQALLLSLVEGITEFLPVSSTGHLILASKLLNIPQTEFVKSFEIIIQLGAILAVVFLYFRTVVNNRMLWKKIFVAFIPTGIIGFFVYRFVKTFLIGNLNVVIASLFIGGVVMLVLEDLFKHKKQQKTIKDLTFFQSVTIGIVQAISMIPGVSRAMATIFGGLGVGLTRKQAVEFSFLLAVPTMLGATALDLVKTNFLFTSQEYLLLSTGFIGAFVSALITVKSLINFVQKHSFKLFAVYRIILAAVFLLLYS